VAARRRPIVVMLLEHEGIRPRRPGGGHEMAKAGWQGAAASGPDQRSMPPGTHDAVSGSARVTSHVAHIRRDANTRSPAWRRVRHLARSSRRSQCDRRSDTQSSGGRSYSASFAAFHTVGWARRGADRWRSRRERLTAVSLAIANGSDEAAAGVRANAGCGG
jgi:hypothetical protein